MTSGTGKVWCVIIRCVNLIMKTFFTSLYISPFFNKDILYHKIITKIKETFNIPFVCFPPSLIPTITPSLVSLHYQNPIAGEYGGTDPTTPSHTNIYAPPVTTHPLARPPTPPITPPVHPLSLTTRLPCCTSLLPRLSSPPSSIVAASSLPLLRQVVNRRQLYLPA